MFDRTMPTPKLVQLREELAAKDDEADDELIDAIDDELDLRDELDAFHQPEDARDGALELPSYAS